MGHVYYRYTLYVELEAVAVTQHATVYVWNHKEWMNEWTKFLHDYEESCNPFPFLLNTDGILLSSPCFDHLTHQMIRMAVIQYCSGRVRTVQ